ncbi:unnamed protein product [Durusdinium trenchii]|uniref:SAP domain-containing protein n=1 Tax=Durusdinium trenchii TaxID=1381693 RepID=A0ABP0KET8_9DINO
MEIFDLTQGDSNEEQEGSEAEDETSELTIFAVTEIAETYEAMDDEETFYDCDEELKDELKPPSMEETEAQTSGHRDDGEAKAMVEPMKICMIKNVVALEVPSVIMTIDSGADVSVAPERFYNLGVPGAGKPIEMIDAQGAKICSKGNRRLRLQAQTRDGEVIEFIEQFALGVGVTHPLLSFGRLLKQGWGLSKDDHGLFLEHPEKTVKIPARLERNSLVMDVKICAVRAEGDEPEELQVNAVSGGREEAVESGGDARPPEHPSTPAGESAAAACEKGDNEDDDVTMELMHQLSNEDDPGQDESRSPGYTTEESGDIMVKGSSSEDGKVKEKLARWERWNFKFKEVKKEPVELSSPEEQVRPVRGAPRQLHGYISRELSLLERLPGLIKDYFVVTSEVPVSQYPLLNGEPASWPEDEQEDQEGGEIPWLAAGGGERPEIAEDVHFVDPDELEVSIDELTFNKDNKLKDLQDMCRKLGLPTSGSKVKVLRRLQQYKHHEEEKIAYEIAQRLYSEQRREAIPVKTPKLPTKHEQELHQLTHLPFQAWCQQCVATRAKEDVRTDADTADRKDRGRNVISFDYGYTYTSGAAEEKQWGTALYVAESESKAVLCIPVQAKGSLSLRQITEELTRFSMQVCNTQPIDAEGNEMIEQEAKTVGEDVALGMYGHGPDTEDVSPKRQKTAEAGKPETSMETERHTLGSSSVTTLPQGSLKRELFSLPWDAEDDEKLRMSPKKKVRAIQEEFPGGDDMLAEEILQSALNDVSEDEEGEGHAKERPPDVSEEELAALDDEACRHEERRLEQMGVLEKVKDGEPDEEGEEPEEEQQPQQVEHETDIEKVNMQWQIVRLEVALAEKDEYLKEMTEEKDRMMHEYLRFADMNVNLRGQLEDLREENLGLTNRLLRRGGGHDEKEQEIQRLDEEIKQLKEVNVLLKARIDEMNQASNSRLKESLDGVKFEMERKQWMMTHSGECYHSETCSHVANRAKKVIRPCPYCVPTTMRAVTGFEAAATAQQLSSAAWGGCSGGCWTCWLPYGAGWQSVGTMKDHVDAHLSGALQGDIPPAWLQAQGRQRCPVCGLSVSIRHGAHPTFRPLARAAVGHAGEPRAAGLVLPSVDETQASQTPTLRHIPQAARHLWGQALTRCLASVVRHNDATAWQELLMLPKTVLDAPKRGGRQRQKAVASYTLDRLQRWQALRGLHPPHAPPVARALHDLLLAPEVVPDAVAKALRSFPAGLQAVQQAARSLGLTLNLDKCELVAVGPTSAAALTANFPAQLLADSQGNSRVLRNFDLLGAAIGAPDYVDEHTQQRVHAGKQLLDAIASLEDPQVGLRLLRACAGHCRLVHSMRCNPPAAQRSALLAFDAQVRACFSRVTGLHLDVSQWGQASRGFGHAGLGLRATAADGPVAYLASIGGCAAACSDLDAAYPAAHLQSLPAVVQALAAFNEQLVGGSLTAGAVLGQKQKALAGMVDSALGLPFWLCSAGQTGLACSLSGKTRSAGKGGGVAAAAYARVKAQRLQTAIVCERQGVRFQPVVFESTGAFDAATGHVLQQLARAVAARAGGDASELRGQLLQELCSTVRAFRARAPSGAWRAAAAVLRAPAEES